MLSSPLFITFKLKLLLICGACIFEHEQRTPWTKDKGFAGAKAYIHLYFFRCKLIYSKKIQHGHDTVLPASAPVVSLIAGTQIFPFLSSTNTRQKQYCFSFNPIDITSSYCRKGFFPLPETKNRHFLAPYNIYIICL